MFDFWMNDYNNEIMFDDITYDFDDLEMINELFEDDISAMSKNEENVDDDKLILNGF